MSVVKVSNLKLDMSVENSLTGGTVIVTNNINGGGFDSGAKTSYNTYLTSDSNGLSLGYYAYIATPLNTADSQSVSVTAFSLIKSGVRGSYYSIEFGTDQVVPESELLGENFASHSLFSGNDTFTLDGFDDYAAGGAGNDTFTGKAGNDTLLGQTGTDTAVYSNAHSQYSIVTTSAGATSITALTGDEGTDTLSGIERLTFSDGTWAYDTNGISGQTYRLYQAAFGRTPDTAGLAHNIGLMDDGLALNTMANAFVGSAEFKALYGENTSDTTFINALYNNVLSRNADAAGLAGWQERLSSGEYDRAGVLLGFSESAENQALVGTAVADGIFLG